MARTTLLLVVVFLSYCNPLLAQVRLMSAARDAELRKSLPRTDSSEINDIFRDPQTILYTDEEIPKAYQFNMGGSGIETFHWAGYNISGDAREAAKGPGRGGNGNIEFPWRTPGGTDNAESNVRSFRFLYLPKKQDGSRWPVVYFNERKRAGRGGRVTVGLSWLFPEDTVLGECLAIIGPDGMHHTFEVRLRIRESNEWGVEILRPFPHKSDLVKRIKQLWPDWQSQSDLKTLMAVLEEKNPIHKDRVLRDRLHPVTAFNVRGGMMTLPPLSAAHTAKLLDTTDFQSALGTAFSESRGVTVHAPTTTSDFHIVPRAYHGTFLGTDRESCLNCHKHVAKHVDDFDARRDWYGRIRGSDGIFSFHPVATSSIATNGASLGVRIRPSFLQHGVVAAYDRQRHPISRYRRLAN